jgi:transketolase
VRWPARCACPSWWRFYDDNGISIDGHVEGWFTDDTPKRFAAYGWNVIPDVNGHDSRRHRSRCPAGRQEVRARWPTASRR